MLGRQGCRIVSGLTLKGYQGLILENRWLQIWVLPGKGSDIVQFLYKPADVDFTWSAAWGLRPRREGLSFLDQYEGGWQEVFPNGGTLADYQGAPLDQHDEVAGLPWNWQVVEERVDRVVVRLQVDLLKTPFRVEKELTLTDQGPVLTVSERVQNLSPFPQRAMWGHHLAFGPPFLTPNCRIATGAGTVLVGQEPVGARRYRPGRYAWPFVDGSDGARHDLRRVPSPGPERDIVYLTDFKEGYYRLGDPASGLGLAVRWDHGMLPYCWYWQELGANGYPWYGRHYNIGLEPFAGYPTHGLREAMENGSALTVDAHGELGLTVSIAVEEAAIGG